LTSIQDLSASERFCLIFIRIVVADLQIFGSAQTLNQSPSSLSIYGSILLIFSDSVSRPLRISEIESIFLADPLSRQFANSSLLIRFSKRFVNAAVPRLKELLFGGFMICRTKFFHPLSNFQLPLGVAYAREEGIVLRCLFRLLA
jgi:hypothetical protein